MTLTMTTSGADGLTTTTQSRPAQDQSPCADGLIHIVGWWQGLLDDLRIKVPRGLCGTSLAGEDDPDVVLVPCPQCYAINGGPPRGRWVQPHEIRPFLHEPGRSR
ncbi:hypothetical protein [Mycobacteroides salmoniphilum]|uniref:Uncharacterized protein n=1 Tax=Mycobacteroides salmoniphilum TaxID=404941 RepID=A0A4R8T004_9MYCO|nr:hypothetical protein [Mycobacteroides salmoniphilum]TEA09217.1 hypothetical protein CCUG60884_00207 [Mycobacteroides salmoniphilum]